MSVWIDNFKAEIGKYGVAESNKFEVMIDPPAKMQSLPTELGSLTSNEKASLVIRAESVNLAGRAIDQMDDSNIYGPIRQLPAGVTYAEDVEISFIMSRNFWERGYFDTWQHQIFDKNTWNIGYYNNFIGSIAVYALDRHQNRIWGMVYHECWPKVIGAANFNMSSLEVVKLPINFAFRYWTQIPDDKLLAGEGVFVDSNRDDWRAERSRTISKTVDTMKSEAERHVADRYAARPG